MEGRLTKEEALRRCAKLWDRIADEIEKGGFKCFATRKERVFKELWPEYKWGEQDCFCWACAYHDQYRVEGRDCSKVCILKHVWPDGCLSNGSPYQMDTVEGARQIADGAREGLRMMHKGVK
jgi:hypothetical protein